jgi:hypothetical protein
VAKIAVSISRSGQPCLSEIGGGFDSYGKATIITDLHFNPKIPVFVRNTVHKNGEVAIFKVRRGDHVITCMIDSEENTTTKIYKIKEFSLNPTGSSSYAIINLVAEYKQGTWTGLSIPDEALRAAQACKGKASCHECTHIHYFKQRQEVIDNDILED